MRCYDEMRHHDDAVRPHYARFERWLVKQGNEAIARKRAEADLLFPKTVKLQWSNSGVVARVRTEPAGRTPS